MTQTEFLEVLILFGFFNALQINVLKTRIWGTQKSFQLKTAVNLEEKYLELRRPSRLNIFNRRFSATLKFMSLKHAFGDAQNPSKVKTAINLDKTYPELRRPLA